MQIVTSPSPGTFAYYEHPTPATTLKRKVTITLRYAGIIEDSDPRSCGGLDVQLGVHGYEVDYIDTAYGSGNACSEETWNFPNESLVMDNLQEDVLVATFKSCDDDMPFETFPECAERTVSDLWLTNDQESFTETRTVRLYPSPETEYSSSDLMMDMTFDLEVEYHS